MPSDILQYKVLIGGADYTFDLKEANTTQAMNEYSTAEVVLANDNSKYTTGTAFGLNSTLVLSASRDGGASYVKLFDGYVSDLRTEVHGGDHSNLFTIAGSGGGGTRKVYVSPNQVVIGPCDLGAALTGTSVDGNTVSWTTDSKGNYPNGLLYKLGYGLTADSVTDIFPTQSDIPSKVILNGKNIFDALTFFRDTYAMSFLINEQIGSVSFLRDPIYTNFPTYSFTLSSADLLSYTIERDSDAGAGQVLVVGDIPQIFSIVGNSGSEIRFDNAEISDYLTAYYKSSQQYQKQSATRSYVTIETYPMTNPLLGKRITLQGAGLSSYGNVIGVTHKISNDRWTTALNLEAKQMTVGALYVDVQKKMKEFSASDSAGQIYLYCEGTRSVGINNLTPVAIGYGSSSASTANCKLGAGLAIRPLTTRITDTASSLSYNYLSINRNDVRGRVREFVLFGTSDPNGYAYDASSTFALDWNTASITSTGIGMWSRWMKLTTSLPGNIPMQVLQFRTYYDNTTSYYWWKPMDMSVYVLTFSASQSAMPTPIGIKSSGVLMNTGYKNLLSVPDSYSNFVLQPKYYPMQGGDCYLFMEIPTQLPTWSYPGLMSFSFSGIDYEVTDTSTYNYYWWDRSASSGAGGWATGGGYALGFSQTSSYYHGHWLATVSVGGDWSRLIDSDGIIRILMRSPGTSSAHSFCAQYYQVMFRGDPSAMGAQPSFSHYLEPAIYDPATKKIITQHPVTTMVNIWITGSTDSSGAWIPDRSTRVWTINQATVWKDNQPTIPSAQPGGNIIPLSSVGLQDAEWEYSPSKRYKLFWGLGREVITDPWGKAFSPTTTGGGVMLSVEEYMSKNRSVLVEYTSQEILATTPPATKQTLQATASWISYSADMVSGTPYMHLDETTPAYGTQLVINYTYLGTGSTYPALARFTVPANSRIDQGIALDGRSDLHLMIKYKYGTTSNGSASIGGHGVWT